VVAWIAKLLRWASLTACLIVIASFAIFAVNQTSSASTHQQEELNGGPLASTAAANPGSPQPSSSHEDGIHKAIDDASNELTSPFSGITSGFSNEWLVRGVNLLGALILYGFGLGYLARVIRVRV
jgi:hypothetical protein